MPRKTSQGIKRTRPWNHGRFSATISRGINDFYPRFRAHCPALHITKWFSETTGLNCQEAFRRQFPRSDNRQKKNSFSLGMKVSHTGGALGHGFDPISTHQRVCRAYPAWSRISEHSSIPRGSPVTDFHQSRFLVDIKKSSI
jgi:hypothetical protein